MRPEGQERPAVTVLQRGARTIFDFVVGDDPLTAVGVVAALGLTAALAGAGISAWWVMPVAVLVLLAASLWRAAR